MIDHDRALELAAASIDFGLSATDDGALTEHLEACSTCRTEVAALRSDAASLRSLETIDAPAGLRGRILEALEDAAGATPTLRPEPRSPLLRFPRHIPRPAALAAAAAIIVAVVGGTLWWRATPAPDQIAVIDPSTRPAPSASAPGPEPSPNPSAGPSGPPVEGPRLARITAEDETGGVVGLDTSFQLAAIGNVSAEDLASRVRVNPKIELTTTVEGDGRVRLTPVEPLTAGVVYRFELTTPDGAATDSWAFQAKQPVRVVTTLPNDEETDVPLDTGIEVTFDQDGVVGAEEHFSIQPRAKGRFEQHGRVLSFVPDRLRARTIYTVTISRGVAVQGTGEILERDVRFRFETGGSGSVPRPRSQFRFSNDLFESPTRDRPVLGLWWFGRVEGSIPKTARLDIFRFPDREAAIDAFVTLREVPRWSRWNAAEKLTTSGTTRVARVNAQLREGDGTLYTTLPERLSAGWYLIRQPDGQAPAHTILQVTDVTAYLAVSERTSVIWANDAASGKPLRATVASGGATVGRTDAQGLLIVDSPAAWLPEARAACIDDCTRIVTVTAGRRSAFAPATEIHERALDFWGGFADEKYWLLFDTDRIRYRRTDTIHAWGLVRDRDGGAVPADVEIGLIPADQESDVPVTLTRSRPGATGAFTASLGLKDVPEGGYRLALSVRGKVVASRYIGIERIIKPAYRIDIATGRRVYVAGDRIRATASARFFEGTPVPGVPVKVSGDVTGSATTDASGTATIRGVARWDAETSRDSARQGEIAAWPARAEERGDISATHDFVIFPSHWLVDGQATLQGRRIRIAGTAAELARDRLERAIADGLSPWEIDPLGQGLTGKTVRVRVVEQVPVKTRNGTSYDFVEKRAVPTYDYSERDRVVGTLRLRTGAGGRFSGSIAISNTRHTYRVELSITDPDGLRWNTTSYAYGRDNEFDENLMPFLGSSTAAPGEDRSSASVGVGERIDLRMYEPRSSGSQVDDRHLFYAAQGGIREATIRPSDRFVTRFPDWGPPNVIYAAVRFTGRRYVAASPFRASFRAADRSISVSIAPDRDRYAPNQTARLSITTKDANGAPIPATVVIRAVDEKLYSIGGAADIDPLGSLYEHVGHGIVAVYATHHGPSTIGEGGDTTGGGSDDAPKDTILFRAVETDAAGRASVDMIVPADLTSWHVSASAIGAALEAGGTTTLIPVGLPFFVDTAIAPEYLASDRPTLQIRGFGSALRADSQVTFSVDSETLGLHERGLSARAFQAATVPLPMLTVGAHRITITAQSGRGASLLRHVLTRSFTVVPSRLVRTRATYAEPTSSMSPDGGGEATEFVVADAGIGRLLPLLHELAGGDAARMEIALAADVAAGLVADRFDGGPAGIAVNGFNRMTYQRDDGGIAILPYASSDLEASVMAAVAAPERFDGAGLRAYLHGIARSQAETRERRNLALAGLAGTGEPVLPAVRASLMSGGLTVRERLFLGIGAARLGDAATARGVATALAAESGQQAGSVARLRVGADGLDTTTATALMAMLCAAYGDPTAHLYRAYVAENATDPRTFALHSAAYARWSIDHVETAPASFAYVLDGKRTEITLEPGEVFRTIVISALRPSFSIEPMSGRIGVTSTWREAVDVQSIETDPDIRISRTVRPSGTIGQGSLARVELTVRFGPHASSGCHRVVDLVPSGLVPIASPPFSIDPETGESRRNTAAPDSFAGQRVIFCAQPTAQRRSVTLRYYARVISTGAYRWEPAIAESRAAADRATVVPARNVTIR